MIRDNASTSTRIDWRRGGTITSRKLRETRSWHLGSLLGVRVSWGRGGAEEQTGAGLQNEGRKKKGPRRGLKGADLGVESGRAEVCISALSDSAPRY
jgi:hypothetical protein